MMSSAPPPPAPRHAAAALDRCSSCGARLRPEETWCSLCHTSVADQRDPFLGPRTPEIEDPEPNQDASFDPDVLHQLKNGDSDGKPGAGTEPGVAESPEPTGDPAVNAAADRMLAQLAVAETVLERESRWGSLQLRLTELAGGWGAIVLASVGGVVLLGLGLGGLTLLGLLL